jgi:hypothetical protein
LQLTFYFLLSLVHIASIANDADADRKLKKNPHNIFQARPFVPASQ